jgi:replication factor C subunit 2/4
MPGIGKTTSIMALAHALLGDAFKEGVLELNASDERYCHQPFNLINRGLDVVRNRIKGFAQKKVTLPPGRHKIVILDEADRYFPKVEKFSLKYDFRGSTSPPSNHGNLRQHNTVRISM